MAGDDSPLEDMSAGIDDSWRDEYWDEYWVAYYRLAADAADDPPAEWELDADASEDGTASGGREARDALREVAARVAMGASLAELRTEGLLQRREPAADAEPLTCSACGACVAIEAAPFLCPACLTSELCAICGAKPKFRGHRCSTCTKYFQRNGVERPRRLAVRQPALNLRRGRLRAMHLPMSLAEADEHRRLQNNRAPGPDDWWPDLRL